MMQKFISPVCTTMIFDVGKMISIIDFVARFHQCRPFLMKAISNARSLAVLILLDKTRINVAALIVNAIWTISGRRQANHLVNTALRRQ